MKMTKDEMKNKISMALKDPILQQGFEIICKNLSELEEENTKLKAYNEKLLNGDIEKHNKIVKLKKSCNETQELLDKQIEATYKLGEENAELKEELHKWKAEWQEQVQKENDESYARTLQTIQLTKAKELIRRLINSCCSKGATGKTTEEAEQFLKEVE